MLGLYWDLMGGVMECPHCKKELTFEELKHHISPEELKKLWASHNGSKMTEARRQANIERNRVRWQKEVPNGTE